MIKEDNDSIKYALSDIEYDPKLSHWKKGGQVPLEHKTIGRIVAECAHKFGDRKALSLFKGNSLTYSEVLDKTDQLAAAFIALGLRKGDHLAIWGFNSLEWVLAFFAAVKCGLTTVNLNPLYESPELISCLLKADVKAIVMDEGNNNTSLYDKLKNVITDVTKFKNGYHINSEIVPLLNSIIIISEKSFYGSYRWIDLFNMGTENDFQTLKKVEKEINTFESCNIQFTSGTTNSPKAVLLNHYGIVNNSFAVGKLLNLQDFKEHKSCVPVPFFHTFGTVAALMTNFQRGSTVVIPSPKFSPNKTIDCLIDEKCTLMYGTPTMYIDLLNIIQKRSISDPQIFNKLVSLKRFFSGGAICVPSLIQRIKEHFKEVKFSSGYGMTEILSPFMTLPNDSEQTILNVVGRLIDYLEVKIINDKGETVPLGEEGELCCRGYSVTKGYYNDPIKTNAALTKDGWFHTGDRFIFLENGYAQIIGRIKETIIRGGENIEPREIENLLMKHEKILNAQVFGVSCERLGEIVAVSIIKKDQNKDMSEEEVQEFCKGKIALYKIPQHIFFVDEFPRTTSGKIKKFVLRENAEKAIKHKQNV